MKLSNNLGLLLVASFSLAQITIVGSKRIYWPPVNNETVLAEIDGKILDELEQGCSNTRLPKNSTVQQIFFIVSKTTNTGFNNPQPVQFTHMPSGQQIDLDTNCDNCALNELQFNGTTYQIDRFECKNLCVFTANNIPGNCQQGRNFEVGLKIENKFLKLFESCHKLEKTNNTYEREQVRYKVGYYSRKINANDHENNCIKKCMPVCVQPAAHDGDFDEFDSDESVNKEISSEMLIQSFMENLCNNGNETLEMSSRISSITCDGNGGVNMHMGLKAFIVTLWMLVVWKY